MRRPKHNTTSLPRELREELGLKDSYGDKKRKRSGPVPRRDRRQTETANKRQRGPVSKKRNIPAFDDDDDEDEGDGASGFGSEFDESDDEGELSAPRKSSTRQAERKPKSILKKFEPSISEDSDSDLEQDYDDDDDDADDTDEEQPAPRKISETVKARLAEDDAEIAALEKKLGLKKGRKLPKSFMEDGLGELLGDLDGGSDSERRKRKLEADEWLRNKRRKAQGLATEEKSDSESDEDDMGDLLDSEEEEDDDGLGSEDDEEFGDDDDGFHGFDEKKSPRPKKRENPYVAPVAKPDNERPNKYIPPSLRTLSNSETESLTRLRRQAQGHLNKLSDSNLVSILAEIEKLYRDYPRQNVTSTLISLLLGLICERSALQDTFIILHAGFIAAIYKVIGIDFGAELVQKMVERFDAAGDDRSNFEGKESVNLISLLSQLYNFHVIGSTLVFDYIRIFLQDITEANTELLLKIIRNSGPQLRQDDPSALKDIVLLIQPAVAKVGEASLSVRTKFMIDTITDLKNNRVKAAGVGSSIASEHITKMRKILGALSNNRVIRASEPIRVSRIDILNSTEKGKWWLVGASWKEDPLESARQELSALPSSLNDSNAYASKEVNDDEDKEPDLLSIAKAQRMNTDVRRSIFVAIMSATDYQDAHVRLHKLRLKRAQDFEIPRVLIHCCMEEESYNPYYTLISRRVCGEMGRRIKVSFMYTLWNVFKKMGERGDLDNEDDDDSFGTDDNDDQQVTMKAIVNLAKMYGSLIADGTLTLSILKNLNFAYLQPKTKAFVELLIITVIQQSQKKQKKKPGKKSKSEPGGDSDEGKDTKALTDIFRTRDTPQIVKGLIFFVRRVVSKTDIVSGKELKLVRWGCKVALDALRVVSSQEDGLA